MYYLEVFAYSDTQKWWNTALLQRTNSTFSLMMVISYIFYLSFPYTNYQLIIEGADPNEIIGKAAQIKKVKGTSTTKVPQTQAPVSTNLPKPEKPQAEIGNCFLLSLIYNIINHLFFSK